MIIEAILVVSFALILDFFIGDPKNRIHPTILMGKLIEKIVPYTINHSPKSEKRMGIILVVIVLGIVVTLISFISLGFSSIKYNESFNLLAIAITIGVGSLLLKTTIAIRGLEEHATTVMDALENDDLDSARNNLAMIVKRNTRDLDENHIISGTLESVGENTVDGITGPLFYFAFLGLPGAFAYRAVNTIDSMIGYKNNIFKNVGWFGANCDKILNYLPSRITGFVMILSAMILGNDWKGSYQIMKRDGLKPESPNSGYPMAALAGALGTRFEKINHYTLGEGNQKLNKDQIKSAIAIMKVTSILFCVMVTIPIIVVLAYLGWWIHA
jgi:adenosylcobinamide-phosphate synthase